MHKKGRWDSHMLAYAEEQRAKGLDKNGNPLPTDANGNYVPLDEYGDPKP